MAMVKKICPEKQQEFAKVCLAPLCHRQIQQFLSEIHEDYGDDVYHTDVRWFGRGSALSGFYSLRLQIERGEERRGEERRGERGEERRGEERRGKHTVVLGSAQGSLP
ncbi:hypothetical protein D4764_0247740 [Takifugu flavidus]|uniref:Uncharacterized protein n=1 Tax=Takifugu flavidus TaxID=433684 RepID=A0A5C6MEM4_9TELE|nr:hypothetical protein D4764_0247740 [Takifugu flavidus]